MICELCNKKYPSYHSLSLHIIQTHKITTKEYYDKFFKVNKNGICYCEKETNFKSLSVGYHKYCSVKCQSNDPKIIEKRKVSGDDHWTRRKEGPNKGKTYEQIHGKEKAKELKEKLSEDGKKLVGEKNPFYRKTHTFENKVKFREYREGKTYEQLYGFEKAREIKKKQTGRRKNQYSDCKYSSDFYDLNLRKSILESQDSKCAICLYKLEPYKKNLHHINYVKKDNRRRNLIYLCVPCHSTTNGNRVIWKAYLRKLNREIIYQKKFSRKLLRGVDKAHPLEVREVINKIRRVR